VARTTSQKLELFKRRFRGRRDAYITRSPNGRRVRQVKEPLTDQVLLEHLRGKRHCGLYTLDGTTTWTGVADFDTKDPRPALDFVAGCQQYQLDPALETSRSGCFHVWVWTEPEGVEAWKLRQLFQRILEEIDQPETEIFPKQDSTAHVSFGNAIFLPLCGALVPQGFTAFVDPTNPAHIYRDQWEALTKPEELSAGWLDELVALNELDRTPEAQRQPHGEPESRSGSFPLAPCAQRMLAEGVTDMQRNACFRLAVQLKKAGLPRDLAEVTLAAWAEKNRPTGGKRKITDSEIQAQVKWAYNRSYQSIGCEDPAVMPFRGPGCPCVSKHTNSRAHSAASDPNIRSTADASNTGGAPNGTSQEVHK
jgi:hypothetical protein